MSHRTLARLKEQAKHLDELAQLAAEARTLGISHAKIARACRPRVKNKSLVSHVFAGRAKSSNVVETAKRLIAEAKTRQTSQNVA